MTNRNIDEVILVSKASHVNDFKTQYDANYFENKLTVSVNLQKMSKTSIIDFRLSNYDA